MGESRGQGVSVTRRGLVKKKALKRIYKSLLVIGFVAALFIPLLPIVMKGTTLLNDEPEFCASCHMMEGEFRNWRSSSHKNWASCPDCHISQTSIVTKIAGKLRDSINHGYAYLFSDGSETIRIKALSGKTVMQNCLRCHQKLVSPVHKGDRKCWDCHRGMPHGY
ncbi:MAG: NapC/NirT family cytochrome c [Deltaproteobacteria bacterium]|nr:NapC/NirT family cytochrome c [Deltaproteobacteria bacterium]